MNVPEQLRRTCRAGAAALDPAARPAVLDFVRSQQRADGGFAERDGSTSDVYYTLFGAGCLDALGGLGAKRRLRAFVLTVLSEDREFDFIHTAALAQLAAGIGKRNEAERLAARLESWRASDGGWHGRPDSETGSAYAAFAALQACQACGLDVPNPDGAVRSIEALRRDGGFVNEPGTAQSQVNATAAAVCALLALGGSAQTAAGLRPDGGGLLSMATTLFAMKAAAQDMSAVRPECLTFIEACWRENGGFGAMPHGADADVEYTFYALLALGALQ